MKTSHISRRLLAATLLVSTSSLGLAANPVFTMKAPTLDANPQVQIIGGWKADPAQWPATFVFANPAGGGDENPTCCCGMEMENRSPARTGR